MIKQQSESYIAHKSGGAFDPASIHRFRFFSGLKHCPLENHGSELKAKNRITLDICLILYWKYFNVNVLFDSTFPVNSIIFVRGFSCLDRSFFVGSPSLPSGGNATLLLHLC